MTERKTGAVKWFNKEKGYGFIEPSEGGTDVFVHITALQKAGMTTLNEKEKIEYELETSRGKVAAVGLKRIDG